jgi:MFS family permease
MLSAQRQKVLAAGSRCNRKNPESMASSSYKDLCKLLCEREAMSKRIFFGWFILLAVFLVSAVTFCSGYYTISVFLEPLKKEFSSSTTQISIGFTIAAILVGFLTPIIGVTISKIGVKKILLFGIVVESLTQFCASFMQSLWHYYLMMFVLAFGLISVSLVPCQTIVADWFVKKRGLAMGVTMTSTGFGGMAMVFLVGQVIDVLDWRWAYRILGLLNFFLILPIAFFFIKNKPQDIDQLPDGESLNDGKTGSIEPISSNMSIKEGIKSIPFYLCCALNFSFYFCIGAMTQHAIAMVASYGFQNAYQIWSTALGFGMFARLSFGALADRYSLKPLLFLGCLFNIIWMAAFLLFPTVPFINYIFMVLYGLSPGIFVTLFPLLVSQIFGTYNLSKFLGVFGSVMIVGLGLGPLLLGNVFDSTGSYNAGLQILLWISIINVIIVTVLKIPVKRLQLGLAQ